MAGEKIHCIPDPVNCSRGSLNHSHGFLEPNNCGNCRTGCLPSDPSTGARAMGDPLMVMADRPMGVQATGVQPSRLARSSIQAWLPDGLIRRMGARASAKISASPHRCCCHCCERAPSHPSCRVWAPIPNSNCLAFLDARQNCLVDLCGALQQFCSVPIDRSAGTHCSSYCSNCCCRAAQPRGRWHSRSAAALAQPSAAPLCCLGPRRSADSATRSWSLREQLGVRWPRSSRGSESLAVCRSRNAHSETPRDSSVEDACGLCRTLCPRQ